MTRKTTAYARSLRHQPARKAAGISVINRTNTRLTPGEIKRIIDPCKKALEAFRQATASHSQWVVLCTAGHVAEAIEDHGIIRLQRHIINLANAALESIGDRSGHTAQQWQPKACYAQELSALADLVAAHSRQVHELTYGEYTESADKAVARVAGQGGKVFRIEPTNPTTPTEIAETTA